MCQLGFDFQAGVLAGDVGDQNLRLSHERRLSRRNVRREVRRKDCWVNVEVAILSGLDPLGGRRRAFLDGGTAFPSVQRESRDIDKRRNVWIVASFGEVRIATR
jgi:hypothetical protein